MILKNIGYSYRDITIVPAKISGINSRSECDVFYTNDGNKILPIFTAPMASVVSDKNYKEFEKNNVIPIIPRNIDINTRILKMNEQIWVALSLKEFEDLFIINYKNRIEEIGHHYYICIDIANGHMQYLYDLCIKAKYLSFNNNYKLTIMTGNIANPDTYEYLCELNYKHNKHNKNIIDYIRIGIGGGSACITTSNTSCHYPQATLLDECYKIKSKFETVYCPYIIADGGIRNYDHVIKALALGADYVMIGSLFAQCIESAGIKYMGMNNSSMKFNYEAYVPESLYIDNKGNWYGRIKQLRKEDYIGELYVKFFGMASADGQKSITGEKTKTAEGITKYLLVKYMLSSWIDNMISYLKSAMSYCNCYNIYEFIGTPEIIINSPAEVNAVNS